MISLDVKTPVVQRNKLKGLLALGQCIIHILTGAVVIVLGPIIGGYILRLSSEITAPDLLTIIMVSGLFWGLLIVSLYWGVRILIASVFTPTDRVKKDK